jgi:DNA-binding XRE family transcriptional regulator
MNAIHPIAINAEIVTLSRADYDALLEALANAEDTAAARAAEAAVVAGTSEYLSIDMVERLANEHPLRVWREHRGLTGTRLAELSGVPQSYISEIETGRKPGSFEAMIKLSRALNVSLDDLVIDE